VHSLSCHHDITVYIVRGEVRSVTHAHHAVTVNNFCKASENLTHCDGNEASLLVCI
jgi:hypothetical protein